MKAMVGYCLLLLYLAVVANAQAINTTVQTKYGWVSGFNTTTHKIWNGIRYAQSTAGSNRWQLPQPPTPWDGVFAATQAGPACPQPSPPMAISEDCLFLNIYAPISATSSSLLPVYIFIHGGSFWGGYGAAFDGEFLAGNEIVFVTINYRLGVMGYLNLPALSNASSIPENAGFFGIQDQRFAFAWVQQNIMAFGGNPKLVTIGGQSAGAISVCIHLSTPRSGGLFSHAIMESGECYITEPDVAIAQSEAVAKAVNCTGENVVSCLYNTPIAALVAAATGPIWPSLNQYEITAQPIDLLRAGQYNEVSLLMGTCHDEQSFEACPWYGNINSTQYVKVFESLYGSLYTAALKIYPVQDYNPPVAGVIAAWTDSRFKCPTLEAAGAISTHQTTPIFMYEFNFVPTWQTNKCENVSHSTELGFLFPGTDFRGYSPSEIQLSYSMREWWVSFITSGVPQSNTSGVVWSQFVNATEDYLAINLPQSGMNTRFEEPQCDFWATVLPDGMN